MNKRFLPDEQDRIESVRHSATREGRDSALRALTKLVDQEHKLDLIDLMERAVIRAAATQVRSNYLVGEVEDLRKQLDMQESIGQNLARMVAWYQEKTGIEHSGAANVSVVTCKRCGRQVDDRIILGHLLDHIENREPRMS